MSAVKLPAEEKQSNLPPECGHPIDAGVRWLLKASALGFENVFRASSGSE
jgi:hypothetical protein